MQPTWVDSLFLGTIDILVCLFAKSFKVTSLIPRAVSPRFATNPRSVSQAPHFSQVSAPARPGMYFAPAPARKAASFVNRYFGNLPTRNTGSSTTVPQHTSRMSYPTVPRDSQNWLLRKLSNTPAIFIEKVLEKYSVFELSLLVRSLDKPCRDVVLSALPKDSAKRIALELKMEDENFASLKSNAKMTKELSQFLEQLSTLSQSGPGGLPMAFVSDSKNH